MTEVVNHIPIKNIYYLLSYAFTSLRRDDYRNIETEAFDTAHNLFAAILSKGVAKQLKQGLYREYIGRVESLPRLQGKLEIVGTIRNQVAHKRELSCEYDELTENNLYNQILKTTLTLLLNDKRVEKKYRKILKSELMLLGHIDTISQPLAIPWKLLNYQRNNQSYQTLLGICQLVIEGLLLTTSEGQIKLRSFLNDDYMSRLFERFVFEYYRQEHPEVKVNARQIPWALDDNQNKMLPIMQTDITLEKEEQVLIIDTKYYKRTTQEYYNTHTIHSNNLYQIYTYVKNYSLNFRNTEKNVSGMLLYARTDALVQPNQDYRMSGNNVFVRTLDLGQSFGEIRDELDGVLGLILHK